MREQIKNSKEESSARSAEEKLAEYWRDEVLELPSNIDLVETAVEIFRQKITAAGWEVGLMDVGLQEALNNAIAHGSLGIAKTDPADDLKELARVKLKNHPELAEKKVGVRMSISPKEIRMTIIDPGVGFNPNDLPDPIASENLLKFSGRGIFYMRNFFDEVIFNEKGNEVTLVKKR